MTDVILKRALLVFDSTDLAERQRLYGYSLTQ